MPVNEVIERLSGAQNAHDPDPFVACFDRTRRNAAGTRAGHPDG